MIKEYLHLFCCSINGLISVNAWCAKKEGSRRCHREREREREREGECAFRLRNDAYEAIRTRAERLLLSVLRERDTYALFARSLAF